MTDRRTAILGALTVAATAFTGTSVEAKKKKKKKCRPVCAGYQSCKKGRCVDTPVPNIFRTYASPDSTPYEGVTLIPGAMIAKDGDLYVINRGAGNTDRDSIMVFSSDPRTGTLNFLRQFGEHGTGNSQMIQGSSLCFAGNYLLVADVDGHRIKVWYVNPDTGEATAQNQIGEQGTGVGQFLNPFGVAYSPAHQKAYVVQSHGIGWFDFNSTTGESGNHGILFFSTMPDWPSGAEIVNDTLYFTDKDRGVLQIPINSDGTMSTQWQPTTVTWPSGYGFAGPQGINYNGGRFYVANWDSPSFSDDFNYATQIFDLETDGTLNYIGALMYEDKHVYIKQYPQSTVVIGRWAYSSAFAAENVISLFSAP